MALFVNSSEEIDKQYCVHCTLLKVIKYNKLDRCSQNYNYTPWLCVHGFSSNNQTKYYHLRLCYKHDFSISTKKKNARK